jgi:hypothetical protein
MDVIYLVVVLLACHICHTYIYIYIWLLYFRALICLLVGLWACRIFIFLDFGSQDYVDVQKSDFYTFSSRYKLKFANIYRVARFFLVQHTKTGKNVPNDEKRCQRP